MPINNFIIATESLGKEKAENIIRNNLAVADSKFVVNYYRLSSDYRLLFGGGENYRYRFPKDISGKVRTAMQDIYPQLSDIKIEYSWGGTLAVTMSRLPDFRRVSPNIYSASGYSGQGVAMATMAGRVMSDLIRGHSERFDILSNLPTPMFPGGVTFRWPLMALAMLWYSMKDKF
jgi:gamma-glutamylputrescine oxidase